MSLKPGRLPIFFSQLILVVCISMAVAGAVSFFLVLLNEATSAFQIHWRTAVLFLPLWGLVLFWLQQIRAVKAMATTETILEEIKNPRQPVSALLTPFILFTTVTSHLFGASVGRESAAVQMGASIAEVVATFFKRIFQLPENRSLVLRIGLAAGFASAFGAPWAGFVFAIEHPQHFTKISFRSLIWVGLASFGAFFFATLWGPAHFHWPQIRFLWSELDLKLWVLTSIGLSALCFFYEGLLGGVQLISRKTKLGASIFFAGVLLLVATIYLNSPAYNGLGVNLTELALNQETTWSQFALKVLFLLVSVGFGFKGGEVTPLIAVAALFANASTSSFVFVAASLSALFSFRLRAPLMGIVILAEFFGWPIAALGVLPIFMTWLLNELFILIVKEAHFKGRLKMISTNRRYF